MGCCQSTSSDEPEGNSLDTRSKTGVRVPSRSSYEPTETYSLSARAPREPHRPLRKLHELLAETEHIDKKSALNIVHLFENQNTIPFICRYRRDLINSSITPDRLRDIKYRYTEITGLRRKADDILNQLEEVIDITDEIRDKLLCAKSYKELDLLFEIYNKQYTRSLRLEADTHHLLMGNKPQVQIQALVDHKNRDLDSIEKVKNAICCIVSQLFSKHAGVLDELRNLQKTSQIFLKSTKADPGKAREKSPVRLSRFQSRHGNKNDQSKYERYFKFESNISCIWPHQILAINRGERFAFLSVEVIVPDSLKNSIGSYIRDKFMAKGIHYPLRNEMFTRAFEECYKKELLPLVCRQVREDLTEIAKKSAIEVFARNLRQLLLTPPLKGERILGIDPGFKHGCKLALISETADVLEVGVIYPHTNRPDPAQWGIKLAGMLKNHSCNIIALGNGTACRETEVWLTTLFETSVLDSKHVHYIIVSEQGASSYSCSKVATREFPNMDVNLISAVSIARRLNDPLSEYVKIEPRHLGVGMYQLDISEKYLTKTLKEVVSECVSYVGVDINTASLSLLKYVAGLNEKCADSIIRNRQSNGPFRTRSDLLRVKPIGEKTFMQCAGFIRIEPKSVGGNLDNLLDCTWVHPESYTIATKIIKQCNLNLKDIGKAEFISKIQTFAQSYPIEILANQFDIPSERLKIVLEALQRQLLQDYRPDFNNKEAHNTI